MTQWWNENEPRPCDYEMVKVLEKKLAEALEENKRLKEVISNEQG